MTEEERSGDIYPPYRRKNGFNELAQRIDDHVEYLEDRLRRFFSKALVAFAVLGITSAGALLGFGVVLSQQEDTATEIQKQRYETIYENCIQQNIRHDRAVATSMKLLPKQTRSTVVAILDELQPRVQDCKKQALNRVQGNRDVE